MRRKDREIFGEEIEDILKKGEYGILSTVGMDGKPYAIPISYAWKDGLIHLHCAANAGRKLENISCNSNVCFVVIGDTEVQPDKCDSDWSNNAVKGQTGKSCRIAREVQQRFFGKRDAIHSGCEGQDGSLCYLSRLYHWKSKKNVGTQQSLIY
jgi:hypothetical protein